MIHNTIYPGMTAKELVGKYVILRGGQSALGSPKLVLPMNPREVDPRIETIKLCSINEDGTPVFRDGDPNRPISRGALMKDVAIFMDGVDDLKAYQAQVDACAKRNDLLVAMMQRNQQMALDDLVAGNKPDAGLDRLETICNPNKVTAVEAAAPKAAPGHKMPAVPASMKGYPLLLDGEDMNPEPIGFRPIMPAGWM